MVAGLLLAASFPNIGIAGLAWVAPGLIAASALGKKGWEAFRIGYVAGLAYYLAALYWLLLIPYRWKGIPLAPAAGWLALSAYCALYPATWVWLITKVESTGAKTEGQIRPGWSARTLWALGGAAAWVAWEMIISRLFTGFPWNLLGATQYQMLPLIQISSFTGIYGVTFLLVWVSLSLVSATRSLLRHPTTRSAWLIEILLPFIVATLIFSHGIRKLRQDEPVERALKVTLVQPSIPQTLIWDPSRDGERFQQLIQLSEQALTNQTELLLWPEAAVPKLLRYDKEVFESVTGLARRHRVWMIIGADDAEPKDESGQRADFFNSSFLLDPQGILTGRYRKRALVIFGEYIPLIRWLPFGKWFTPIEGGFTPGDRAVPFELGELKAKTSVLICFEDIFPHLARTYVDPDTDFLVNLTNNGWFGESAAQWQHATCALFRAVENGLPLVRCSNNGLSCWVDAKGRMRQVFRDRQGSEYGPGILTTEIPLLKQGARRAPTFYRQYGDWLGWGCVAITALQLLLKVVRKRTKVVPAA